MTRSTGLVPGTTDSISLVSARRRFLAGSTAGLAVLMFLAARPATAQDLLQKGQDLLKGMGGSGGSGGAGSMLSNSDIASGLKDALRVGTESVVSQLGIQDGFNLDSAIHIPLPDSMKPVQKALKPLGYSAMLDDLELRLNRAAETATPAATSIFGNAITEMTWDDVQEIYKGADDAATQYFRGKMSDPLRDAMRPVVDDSLADVGAIQSYDSVMGQYKGLPFMPDVKANLTGHVLDLGLDGIFHYVAIEEAAIRNNPAKRTTEILQKVFGA
ncbi:DUF4197 domain-containing protein [Oceanibacterium hippocampi]|uniref:DUF4197 domain-containing protein n=1 Tax=Oceanibacterium hippocampi TaxID=745714 RepID=A0A1Y5T4V1_9PROT|nr:DUF4197 domain-containing protein [Oceanibacterium hippocampi]SLN55979.1 hypothetical protein OCH7691_02411 [Oceanibacterium hippocampi]